MLCRIQIQERVARPCTHLRDGGTDIGKILAKILETRRQSLPARHMTEVPTGTRAESNLVALLNAQETVGEALGEREVLDVLGRVVVVRNQERRDVFLELTVALLKSELAHD